MNTDLGVIEGFYGRLYSKEQRNSLCDFLCDNGYSYYIYAPKNDKSLRTEWDREFTVSELENLKDISRNCQSRNLKFGVGISPLKLTENFEEKFKLLLDKLEVLTDEVNIGIIAILFDDIKLYTSSEGQMQNQIVKEVHRQFNLEKKKNIRIIFCPTYYSFDPILEKLFGQRPLQYFSDLMSGLDKSIEVFWTGSRVLSKSITKEDIESINELLGRKVTIWDNYPVNDGKKISTFIYTKEFENRDNLNGTVLSHAVNPMLEANLSKIALSTLPLLYQNCTKQKIISKKEETIKSLFPEETEKFKEMLEILNNEGLLGLDENKRSELENLCLKYCCRYDSCRELLDFLNGVYKFDEACLTS